jgi:hypothetical protein
MQRIPFSCSDFNCHERFFHRQAKGENRENSQMRRICIRRVQFWPRLYVPEEAKGIYSEVQLAVTPPWQPPPAGASPFILSISEPGVLNVTSAVKFLRKNAGKSSRARASGSLALK